MAYRGVFSPSARPLTLLSALLHPPFTHYSAPPSCSCPPILLLTQSSPIPSLCSQELASCPSVLCPPFLHPLLAPLVLLTHPLISSPPHPLLTPSLSAGACLPPNRQTAAAAPFLCPGCRGLGWSGSAFCGGGGQHRSCPAGAPRGHQHAVPGTLIRGGWHVCTWKRGHIAGLRDGVWGHF